MRHYQAERLVVLGFAFPRLFYQVSWVVVVFGGFEGLGWVVLHGGG
jgi:hypothetical protein